MRASEPHGVARWPSGRALGDRRPDALPNGAPWPVVRVLTIAGPDATGLDVTLRSVAGQAYPEARHAVVAPGPAARRTLAEAAEEPGTAYLLLLGAGEALAPGALTALCLEAVLTGADLVAGLRVAYDTKVVGLDAIAQPPGLLRDLGQTGAGLAPFAGGDVLLARAAVARAGGLDPDAAAPVAALWPRLAASGARLARIGRPVLLQRVPGRGPPPPGPGLSIVALTDTGYGGGAGIGHRRLAEALALSGHRVTPVRLADEASPAAAEWTEHFPKAEAAIREGGHDLVLAGNLHGVARYTGLLARIGARVPVVQVMHDLFPVTGRCAFPGACGIIATGCDARCPSPTIYPQLAPGRIAGAFRDKRAALSGPHAPLLLANSAWTEAETRALAPPGAHVARIDLAFPSGVFRPGDRATARRALGLPPDDVLVMFAAVIADAPGKGFTDLAAALRQVAGQGIGFVAVGRLDDPGVFGLDGLVAAGPVGDEETLALWYRACDVYVTASRNETLGQTPVEAGLCGIPTVAYAVSGLTTAVIDGVSGILVPAEPGALAAALADLVADAPKRRRLGAFARIALENRNSYAAAAMRLRDVLAEHGVAVPDAGDGRIRFAPEMLGRFAFAQDRHTGASGTVPAPSPPWMRLLRRAKQAALGRGLPLWLRRALYVGDLLRNRVRPRR